MSLLINLKYGSVDFTLPKDCITREDVATLFGLKEVGLHIKIKIAEEWVNLLPTNDGSFEIDNHLSGNVGYVVGIPTGSSKSASTVVTPSQPNHQNISIQSEPSSFHNTVQAPASSSFHKISPAPATSSFHYTPQNRVFWNKNLGARAAPPMKKTKLGKKTPNKCIQVLKTFLVSNFSNDGTLETILEIKVDLQKLKESRNDFTVNDIQEEICFQLDTPGDKMVILYKGGSPVKDSPNTRGFSSWNNKVTYRAVNMFAFQHVKPNAWHIIKRDYGEYGDLINDINCDDFLFSEETLFGNIENEPSDGNGNECKENQNEPKENGHIPNDTIVTEITKVFSSALEKEEALRQGIVNSFKCLICMESNAQSFVCCSFCGRFLGCYTCIIRVKTCLLCRKKFKCTKMFCKRPLPMSPCFVPGLDDLLKLPHVDRTKLRVEALLVSDDSDTDENDSLPPLPSSTTMSNQNQ